MMENKNLKKIKICTGISILLMAIMAGIVMSLFVGFIDDDKTTIVMNSHTFLFIIIGWFFILILDLIVSWGVGKIYKNQNNKWAKVSSILRYVYSFFLATGILFLFIGFIKNESDIILSSHSSFEYFSKTWSIGLIVFGGHLLTLAYLNFSKNWIAKIISLMLCLAGIGYILTNILNVFFPQYYLPFKIGFEMFFMLPMVLGEIGWAIYMMVNSSRKI